MERNHGRSKHSAIRTFLKKICVQKVSEVDKIRGKNIKVNVAPQLCGLGAKWREPNLFSLFRFSDFWLSSENAPLRSYVGPKYLRQLINANLLVRCSSVWFDVAPERCVFREKVASASLFKDDIKSDILEQSTQKKMKEEKSLGLLGGQYPINSFELEYTLLYFRWQEIAGCSQ